jgi:hypothetical protein
MMQRFELSSDNAVRLLTWAQLSILNLSRYLCLAHSPLELHDDDLDHNEMDHLSWLRLLGEDSHIAPPYSYGRDSLTHIFTCPTSPRGQQTSSIWSLRDGLSWVWLLNLLRSSFLYYGDVLKIHTKARINLLLQDILAIGSIYRNS